MSQKKPGSKGSGTTKIAATSGDTAQFFYDTSMSAGGKGWIRLHQLLVAAEADPIVRAGPGSSELIAILVDLVADSVTARNAGRLLADLSSTTFSLYGKGGGRPPMEKAWSEWARRVEALKKNRPRLTSQERYEDVAFDWEREKNVKMKWTGIRDGISKLKKRVANRV